MTYDKTGFESAIAFAFVYITTSSVNGYKIYLLSIFILLLTTATGRTAATGATASTARSTTST
jgi:hypothetical protein